MQQRGLSEAVIALTEALENHRLTYAIGGAIALGYYTPPRATADIDIGIGIETHEVLGLLRILEGLGCVFEHDRAIASASRGDFGLTLWGYRVDVFLPVFSLAENALESRVRVPFGQAQIWIVSLEVLILLKLLYARTKDYADLERVFELNRKKLNRDELMAQAQDLFGVDDSRVVLLHEYLRCG